MKHSEETQRKLVEKVLASLQNDSERWEFTPDRCVVAKVPGKDPPRKHYQLKSGVVIEMLGTNVYIRVGWPASSTDVELEPPFTDQVRSLAQEVFKQKKAEFEKRRRKEEATLHKLLDLEE